MILAFDTYYFEDRANTVCVAFETWTAKDCIEVHSEILDGIEEYIPGEFYKRELPCIVSLLNKIQYEKAEAIVVDSFVYLDDNKKLGLGGHLYKHLEEKIPIIGVAKTNFASINDGKKELIRGTSKNPLFITAIGVDVDMAVEQISSMAGEHRIPTILKKLDSLSRQI